MRWGVGIKLEGKALPEVSTIQEALEVDASGRFQMNRVV
jgi:hypothetical protein